MLVAALAVLLPVTVACAQDGVRTETVHFPPGASSTSITETIKGYGSIKYVVGAKAGQDLAVTLDTGNASNYFNVTAPGADAAMFVGAESGGAFRTKLASDGDYVIDVYLMRNAARRNEVATFKLDIAVTGAASQ